MLQTSSGFRKQDDFQILVLPCFAHPPWQVLKSESMITKFLATNTLTIYFTLLRYVGVFNALPKTAYIKMIDIWFIFCMVIPFLEVREDDCGILTLFTK